MEKINCDVRELDYNDLMRERQKLESTVYELRAENDSLRWSLTKAHSQMIIWKNGLEMWKECYSKEHERAEKLYDELHKNKSEK